MAGRHRFTSDDAGGVALMAAGAGALICALAAITIDVGSLALRARTLQGAADLAAMSAAASLSQADLAAQATAQANLGDVETTVETGRYIADPDVAPVARFVPGLDPPNAVRVTLDQASPLYFGRWILGKDSVMMRRTATAAVNTQPPRAMFSIGSRLASLDGGVANQLLSGLTGSTVSLNVMDYSALAAGRVNLLGFSNALATELDVTAGDYETLLTRQIDAGRALRVLRDLAGDQADSALSKLTTPATGNLVRLGDLIGLETTAGSGSDQAMVGGLDASVSVLDLVMALLETGGHRQVQLGLGARAGVAALDVWLAIGERPNRSPWLTVTGTGAPIIRTAQARLYVRAKSAQKLSGLAQVDLPIVIELAASEARLNAIDCTPRAVELGVRPGVAKATVGTVDATKLDDFTRPLSPTPATLVSVLGLVSLTGSAEVDVADVGFRSLRFSDADISAQRTKTVTSSTLGTGLISSLIQRLDVDVHVLGLGLGLGGIVQALATLLAPLGPVLDTALNPVLAFAGLSLGQADVRVHGATCLTVLEARPVLVG